MYFTRQWQDTLLVSLHNFFAVVFQVRSCCTNSLNMFKLRINCVNFWSVEVLSHRWQSIELPTLASYQEEASKITRLQEENEKLWMRLSALTTSDPTNLDLLNVPDPPPPPHLMDDFYNIAQWVNVSLCSSCAMLDYYYYYKNYSHASILSLLTSWHLYTQVPSKWA